MKILAKIKEPEKIWLRIGKNKNSPGKLRAQRANFLGVFRCFTRENGKKMVQKWFTNTSKFWINFGKNKTPKFWIAGNFGKNKRSEKNWPIWTLRGGVLIFIPPVLESSDELYLFTESTHFWNNWISNQPWLHHSPLLRYVLVLRVLQHPIFWIPNPWSNSLSQFYFMFRVRILLLTSVRELSR